MRRTPMVSLLLLFACGDAGPPALAVGPVAFSEADLLGLSEPRRETLANLVGFGLAVAADATAELGEPRIGSWEEDRLLDILAAELTLEKHGVGDAVLEARYLTDPQHELTVRHILFFSERWRTQPEREAASAKAERALGLLRDGADFAETASRLSEEPGAEGRQGLLTPGRRGAWVDEFWAAASVLDVGEISPVTETQYGYHILRLEARAIVPFAEARSELARAVADRLEDPAAVLSAWLDGQVEGDSPAERRAAALAEARRRGLRVPDAERAELARRWEDSVRQWSATLGFVAGADPTEVGEQARAALGSTGQGAGIARNELDEHADLMRAWVAARWGPESR